MEITHKMALYLPEEKSSFVSFVYVSVCFMLLRSHRATFLPRTLGIFDHTISEFFDFSNVSFSLTLRGLNLTMSI